MRSRNSLKRQAPRADKILVGSAEGDRKCLAGLVLARRGCGSFRGVWVPDPVPSQPAFPAPIPCRIFIFTLHQKFTLPLIAHESALAQLLMADSKNSGSAYPHQQPSQKCKRWTIAWLSRLPVTSCMISRFAHDSYFVGDVLDKQSGLAGLQPPAGRERRITFNGPGLWMTPRSHRHRIFIVAAAALFDSLMAETLS